MQTSFQPILVVMFTLIYIIAILREHTPPKVPVIEEKLKSMVLANEPIYLKPKQQIHVHDYDQDAFKSYKSMYCISLDRLMDTNQIPLVLAKEYFKEQVRGFVVYANTITNGTISDGKLSFRLEFWIAMDADVLIEFFELFRYKKVHESALDESHAEYLVFRRAKEN